MHDIVLTVFALTGLLALVSLLLPLADRLAIPYAVLLAAVGCAIGAVIAVIGTSVGPGMTGDMVHGLSDFHLTAEALLYIFLPALLFETALNVDVQHLTEEIAPVLLLAVIGVLVCTFVVGIALWAAFVASLAPVVGRWPVLIQAPFYLMMGIAWIIPLKPLIRWSETGSFRVPRE